MSTVLELRDVSKSFGPNRVLRGVSLAVDRGEVYALMGANGAGKSTLIKVLAGVHQADAGQVFIGGGPVSIADPLAAQRHGIATVHQNPNDGVVLDMTVAENLALDTFTDGRSGLIFNRAKTDRHAHEVAEVLGMDLSRSMLRRPVHDLGVSERQLLVLARALSRRPEILILDEPTSALSSEEADRLFELVHQLADDGNTVLFVSHKLAELDKISNHLGVLRDGAMQGEFVKEPGASFDWPGVLRALFDRAPAELRHTEQAGGDEVLRVTGAQVYADSQPLDLTIRKGEVTALLGLLGSGKTELLEWIFGAGGDLRGTITLDGEPYAPDHPAEAIARGVYLVPESRHEQAIVPDWSIGDLMTLPFAKRFSSGLLMNRRKETAAAQGMIERIGVVTRGPEAPIETLSGGNQQKVVIGRWLLGEPKALLLDEPFRGVDINARHDIGESVRELTDRAAVLVATSDIDEALEIADRIVVISQGNIAADLRLGEASRDAIFEAMTHRPSAILSDDTAALPTEEKQ